MFPRAARSATTAALGFRRGRERLRRWLPTAAGLGALAMFAALYEFARPLYTTLLYLVGVRAFSYPFLDLEAQLAAARCWEQGVAVYAADTCDILHRPFNYSPLWLRFSFLPSTEWLTVLGLSLAILFMLSLAALPSMRDGRGVVLTLAALLSPRVAFAIERLNVDVIMFLSVVLAGLLLRGGIRRRVGGYAVIALAALLKFYPVVLLGLAVREKPRLFVWVALCVAAVLGTFVIGFREELALIAGQIPGGTPFSDLFGAINLPRGIGEVMARAGLPLGDVAVILVWVLLVALLVWRVKRLTRWPALRRALDQAPSDEVTFLLLGAVLMDGCFFIGQSLGYRGIHFLFVLPLLAGLGTRGGEKKLRRLGWRTGMLIVVLMWDGALTWRSGTTGTMVSWLSSVMDWRNGIPLTTAGKIVAALLWVGRELIWWWVAAELLGLTVCCVRDTGTVAALRRWLRPRCAEARGAPSTRTEMAAAEDGFIGGRRRDMPG